MDVISASLNYLAVHISRESNRVGLMGTSYQLDSFLTLEGL